MNGATYNIPDMVATEVVLEEADISAIRSLVLSAEHDPKAIAILLSSTTIAAIREGCEPGIPAHEQMLRYANSMMRVGAILSSMAEAMRLKAEDGMPPTPRNSTTDEWTVDDD